MQEQDEILVERALNGDSSAFETLIARYKNLVYGIAFHHLKNLHDAEDVCQETFLSAYRSLYKLEEPAKFSHWLYGIAKNQSLRWLRSQKKQNDVIFWDEVSSDEIASLALQEESRRTLKQELREAIDSLSEKNRIVTILYYLSGYSYKEIAEFLGIKRSTVDSRLQESRKYLREELASMVARELESSRLPETTGGQSVQGIVYGADGRTLLQNASAFARQTIRRWRDNINLYFGPVWTDEQGRYKFTDLPIGDLEVRASAQNFEGISESVTLRPGEPCTLNFSLRKAAIITGKIEIVGEAPLMFFRIENKEYKGRGTVTPNPDGTYAIVLTRSVDGARLHPIVEKELPPSFMEQQGQVSWGDWQTAEAEETTCDLYLRVKGYEPVTISNLKIQRGKETKDVKVHPVHRTGSVSGRVLDEGGNPVAGVELGLAFIKPGDSGYGLDLLANRLTPVAISQSDGSFTLDDAIEGFHKITPTPKADWDFENPTVAVPRGQVIRDIDIIVKPKSPGIIVRGRIFEPDGVTPIVNAQLRKRDVWKHKKGTGSGDSSGYLHTDAEGRYEFRFSNPGAYEITVYSPGGASATHKIEVEEDAWIESLDFVMPKQEKRKPALRGRVLGYGDKKPVGGGHCEVAVTGEGELYFASVKEDGEFEIAKLEDGEYTVRVDVLYFSKYLKSDAKLLPESEAKVNVVDGYGGEVTLYLPRGVTISGKVLSATDGSLIQQPVEIGRKEIGELRHRFRHKCSCTNGKYTYPHGLSPGTYVFRASTEGYKPAERTIKITEDMLGQNISDFDFHLEYEGFGAISGVVTLADDKTPASGAFAAILNEELRDVLGNVRDYKTIGDDGQFLFEKLPRGTYTLFVTAPGFPAQTKTVEIKVGEPMPEVKMQLVKGGTIQGRVVFPPGMTMPGKLLAAIGPEGIADKTVWAEVINGPPVDSLLRMEQFATQPFTNGSFEFKNIPPGRYAVVLSDKSADEKISGAMPQFVEVKSSETTTVELHVKEGGFIEGRVVDAYTGEPIEGAGVNALHRLFGLDKHHTESAADGTYRIERLFPDKFDVYCAKDGKVSNVQKDVPVKSGETTRGIDLRVYKNGLISGKVITSGELPPGYKVWVKEDGRYGDVQSDGEYEVEFTGESGRRTVQLYAPDAKYRIDEPLKEICLDVRDGEVIEGADFEL